MRDSRRAVSWSHRHRHVGSVASLGHHKGVADVLGLKVKGLPAWLMHRTYHLTRVPTANRKVRIASDWALAMFFRRDLVALGRIQTPREEFRRAVPPASSTTAP